MEDLEKRFLEAFVDKSERDLGGNAYLSTGLKAKYLLAFISDELARERKEGANEVIDYLLDILDKNNPKAVNSVKLSDVLIVMKKKYESLTSPEVKLWHPAMSDPVEDEGKSPEETECECANQLIECLNCANGQHDEHCNQLVEKKI